MLKFRFFAALCMASLPFLTLSAVPAQALKLSEAQEAKVLEFYQENLSHFSSFPVILRVLRAQNEVSGSLTKADFEELSKAWVKEFEAGDGEMLSAATDNAATEHMHQQIAEMGGIISDIVVFDAQGLITAASTPKKSYWNGERKGFRETFVDDPDAVFISPLEYDPITHLSRLRLSVPVWDGKVEKAVGVMTIALIADVLLVE